MTRTTFLLATLFILALSLAPRAGLAEHASGADGATGDLPAAEAISRGIDRLAPASDPFQEPRPWPIPAATART